MRLNYLLLLILVFMPVRSGFAQTGSEATQQPTSLLDVFIQEPIGGQALQGLVVVQGSSAVEGFVSASVAFAYHNDPTGTWFLITESAIAVDNGALATWDTTTITDGTYDLRLLVNRMDGSVFTTFVEGLRVRNYSPIETDTPAPPTSTTTSHTPTPGATDRTGTSPLFTSTPASTPLLITATPLPTNPAELSQATIMTTLSRGALAVLGIFIFLGIYLVGRSWIRLSGKPHR